MSSSQTKRPTGRAKSCVVCRQIKSACDARKTAPAPCSRCVSKGVECKFDPNFRRISTRRINQEVAHELHTLRAAQNTNLPLGQSRKEGLLPLPAEPSSTSSLNESQQNASKDMDQLQWLNLSSDEVVLERSVHGFSFSARKILKLFYHFERYLHRHARFIKPVNSINTFADQHPFLFWTILLVSAERYDVESQDGLYDQLCAVNELLLSGIVQTAVQNLETVHALLLLSIWPIAKYRNAYDPSWNYTGLAIQAALSLDCHNPVGADEPFSKWRGMLDTPAAAMEPAVQARTWLGCFLHGARLGNFLGLPPPIGLPHYSRSLKQSRRIAADILTKEELINVSIVEIMVSANTHLVAIDDPSSHYTMTQSYEQQLDALRALHHENWTLDLETQMQVAKLSILGLTLIRDPRDDDALEPEPEISIYFSLALERSMQAAASLVSAMSDLSNQSIPGQLYAAGVLTFYPKHFFTSLMTAATFLFRFLVSYKGASTHQQNLVVTRITEVHKILQSLTDNRDAIAACINIETWVGYLKSEYRNEDSRLVLTHRLGASILWDTSFRSARHRNRGPDGSVAPMETWPLIKDRQEFKTRVPAGTPQRPSPGGQGWNEVTEPMPDLTNLAAMGIWDAYNHDFGIINEPWLSNDAEFAMMAMVHQPEQAVFPAVIPMDVTNFNTMPFTAGI